MNLEPTRSSEAAVDVVVVGAGVTGLACARSVARRGYVTCLLERHPRPGLDTSTHNSGVIHAGLYYPAGTLKARLCVEGARLLYDYCGAHNIGHVRCGKLVVATTTDEIAQIEALQRRGHENGAEGLEIVDAAFIHRREPAVRGVAALFSANTGIVDAESLVKALLVSAREEGVAFLPGTRLVGADRDSDGTMRLGTERETIAARIVVNAAGLFADNVSAMLGGEGFRIYPCRGEYAELKSSRRSLINGLVYPVPQADGHGIGVHLTRSVAGSVWLGPTAHYQERKDDYESHRLPLESFVEPARILVPEIELGDLLLSGSGIRPKLHPPDQSFADFMIRHDRSNPSLVHAAGIESPGLTSCLAIGELVGELVREALA